MRVRPLAARLLGDAASAGAAEVVARESGGNPFFLCTMVQAVRAGETDVTLVNTPTNDTPQVLASGEVAAIGAWQPNSGQAMKAVPGSHPIYTSADEPGLSPFSAATFSEAEALNVPVSD